MAWEKGKIKLADGKIYEAEFLMKNGEVWNVKIHTGDGNVEEIDASEFAHKLHRSVDEVYPFSYELD